MFLTVDQIHTREENDSRETSSKPIGSTWCEQGLIFSRFSGTDDKCNKYPSQPGFQPIQHICLILPLKFVFPFNSSIGAVTSLTSVWFIFWDKRIHHDMWTLHRHLNSVYREIPFRPRFLYFLDGISLSRISKCSNRQQIKIELNSKMYHVRQNYYCRWHVMNLYINCRQMCKI